MLQWLKLTRCTIYFPFREQSRPLEGKSWECRQNFERFTGFERDSRKWIWVLTVYFWCGGLLCESMPCLCSHLVIRVINQSHHFAVPLIFLSRSLLSQRLGLISEKDNSLWDHIWSGNLNRFFLLVLMTTLWIVSWEGQFIINLGIRFGAAISTDFSFSHYRSSKIADGRVGLLPRSTGWGSHVVLESMAMHWSIWIRLCKGRVSAEEGFTLVFCLGHCASLGLNRWFITSP